VAQTHDTPSFTQLLDTQGRLVSKLAESDMTKFNVLGLKKVEAFTFTSVDGKTQVARVAPFSFQLRPQQKIPAAGEQLRRTRNQ
jgi:dipeptidyl-peptidase 4